MKKIYLILTILLMGVLFMACSDKEDDPESGKRLKSTTYNRVNDFDGVSMVVQEETISKTGLTVELKNDSENQMTYGDYFSVEEKHNGKWYEVPPIISDYGFNDIGYDLAPGEEATQGIEWEWLYGKLPEGEYRVIKEVLDFRGSGDFDKHYLADEFTVNK